MKLRHETIEAYTLLIVIVIVMARFVWGLL
jgi:preprotein translocase subunit SecE